MTWQSKCCFDLFCFPDFSGEAGVMLLFSLAPQHQPELTIQKTMAALQQKNNLSSKRNLASAQVNSLSACLLILLRSKGTDVATDCAMGNCGNKRKDCAKHDEAYRQRSRCRSFFLSLSLSGALLIPFTLEAWIHSHARLSTQSWANLKLCQSKTFPEPSYVLSGLNSFLELSWLLVAILFLWLLGFGFLALASKMISNIISDIILIFWSWCLTHHRDRLSFWNHSPANSQIFCE